MPGKKIDLAAADSAEEGVNVGSQHHNLFASLHMRLISFQSASVHFESRVFITKLCFPLISDCQKS